MVIALETVGGMLRRETEAGKKRKISCRFYISPEAKINSQIINHRIKKSSLVDLNIFTILIFVGGNGIIDGNEIVYIARLWFGRLFLACFSN